MIRSFFPLFLTAVAFVGSHLVLSGPLRAPLLVRLGERRFVLVYSGIALLAFAVMAVAFHATARGPSAWIAGDGLWALSTALMLPASWLLLGSLIGNPAFPSPGGADDPARLPAQATGVFAITRHPMNAAFVLWALAHLLVSPTPRSLILCGALAVLAVAGSVMQDRRKAIVQPRLWPAWQARTSAVPFAAIMQRRARFTGLDLHTLGGGLVFWLVATWLHRFSGVPAGIWRWF